MLLSEPTVPPESTAPPLPVPPVPLPEQVPQSAEQPEHVRFGLQEPPSQVAEHVEQALLPFREP